MTCVMQSLQLPDTLIGFPEPSSCMDMWATAFQQPGRFDSYGTASTALYWSNVHEFC